MRSNTLSLFLAFTLAHAAYSATVNFGGNFRTEMSSYSNLSLAPGAGSTQSKVFIASRALLTPNLIVDDHFSVKSQWSLLTSPNFTPDATQPLGVGQGSYILGDPNTTSLFLSRAWLEWTSDIGVFRLGRMPVAWGYGVLYDAGDNVWDDFQTTFDRLEYRLHLGYVVGALAYSKSRKLSVFGNENDQFFYSALLRYDNPEMEVEAGLLAEKQQRAGNQAGELATSSANPYHQRGSNAFPLAQKMAYPMDNWVFDAYLRKTSGYLSYGGEISYGTGTALDFGDDGTADSFAAFAFLLNATFDYRKTKTFLELVYVSGDANLRDGLTGFVLTHRNKRPGLILGRELLGTYSGNNVALGTPFAYGNQDSFSGVLYLRPGFRVDWSPSLTSSLEVVIARKAAVQAGEAADLGVEFDLGSDYALYKNFRVGADFGLLFAGAGLRVASPSVPFALRATGALTF